MKTLTLFAGVAVIAVTSVAFADEAHENKDPSVVARQSHMQLYAHNMGVLGGMAQGKIDYDADAAQSAADNMVALIGMNQMSYWPAGTDNASIEGTKALPALWEDFDNVMVINANFSAAADTMADVAGTDLESLQGAMQALGGACSACHREYRQRN